MVALMTMPILGSARKDISSTELSHRVAVIKRFKELLKAQRDRFRAYLDAMDRQKDVIQGGTADDLLRHVELEEKIVEDIFSIQRVIDPLEDMYQSIAMERRLEIPAPGELSSDKHDEEVSGLKKALAGLKAEAVVRSEQNRELLSKRMTELRSEIKILKSNAYARRNIDNAPAPAHIDIKG